jgi:hypothetical protein
MNISLFLFGTGGPGKKGHHMGDYIPPEELEKFLATCNDAAAQKAFKEAGAKAKIQADNVGHKLLSKMGWKEGLSLSLSLSHTHTRTHARTHLLTHQHRQIHMPAQMHTLKSDSGEVENGG